MAKILIAKVGTDAHDMGVTVVARWLADAGHEIVDLGLYNTPERVARAAVEEAPDLVGLSFLGGEPVLLSERVLDALRDVGLGDLPVIAGGVLTPDMVAELSTLGIAATFTPGTVREVIVDGIAELLSGGRRNLPPATAPDRAGAP